MEVGQIRSSNVASCPRDLTQDHRSVRIGCNVIEIRELCLRGEEEGVAELGRFGRGTVDLTEVDFGGKVLGSGEEDGRFL